MSDLSQVSGAQSQWYELYNAGLNLFTDPSVVLITGASSLVLQVVAEGFVDVGFLRSGTLELALAAGSVQAGALNIVNQQNTSLPYATSTELYPSSVLCALPDVPIDVQAAVTKGLYAIPRGRCCSKRGKSCILDAYSKPAKDTKSRNTAGCIVHKKWRRPLYRLQ